MQPITTTPRTTPAREPAAAEEEENEGAAVGDEEAYPPVVVRGEEAHPEPITVEQAIEILRERDAAFLLFRNSRSEKVALVHVRDDGNYGLVEAP